MTHDINKIMASLAIYADNAGKELIKRLANGYEVSELTAEIEKNHFYQDMEQLVKPIVENDEQSPEFFLALKSLISGLSPDSPTKIFAASAEVTGEIDRLEHYKAHQNYCTSYDKSNIELLSIEEACATIPFLAKACNHLAALQSEVGSVPVCGEDSPVHTDL